MTHPLWLGSSYHSPSDIRFKLSSMDLGQTFMTVGWETFRPRSKVFRTTFRGNQPAVVGEGIREDSPVSCRLTIWDSPSCPRMFVCPNFPHPSDKKMTVQLCNGDAQLSGDPAQPSAKYDVRSGRASGARRLDSTRSGLAAWLSFGIFWQVRHL